ncbi:NAD(P)-binding protein [Alternaria alternata]|jgi:nucleoside-diphosphate-sugar epimerase|uniref:NAD(P)-binding protein n=1 Tax=Alternaria alternata TaxID=5599 RepID=A0A177DZI6_ALTAL|nr:NAD(P)-binding protein [Alternaria alternata]OAG24886.1 NAD(P)-binding protein [Alternaria alternata]
MLVLVPGITGNLGLHLLDSLSSRGHHVRGLGRSPDKLNDLQKSKLESFITIQNYYDISALDQACAGVDAIICAYTGSPVMQLDAQLLLLRAAERADVTRFLAASWNCDWRQLQLGQHQSYDAIIAFHQQAKLSSTIKPIYMLTGALAEVYFSVPGHGNFSPAYNGPWDPEKHTIDIWGTGDEKWDLTTERDAAEFSVEVIQRDDAPNGGFWELHSGAYSPRELANIYKNVKGIEIAYNYRGTLDDLRGLAYSLKNQKPYNDYYSYIGLFYQLFQLDGTYSLKNVGNHKLNVITTSMEDFLRQNPDI